MKNYNVGIIGATGMVGQRFITLLDKHPNFNIKLLAASSRSAGKCYGELMENRWKLSIPMPDSVKNMVIYDAENDIDKICEQVDFVFCAVDMPKAEIRELENKYAQRECPVVSNNSAHRLTPDVPMLIPEINPQHAEIIVSQRKRLGTTRGFIAVKPNCSIQGYVPTLSPLRKFGLNKISVCTYQAISGAGKTFETFPEIIDNVIPFIGGEEEKSEVEPLKIWGNIENGEIKLAESPIISAQCVRVPVSDGHLATVSASFDNPPSLDEIKEIWDNYKGRPQELKLPSAPEKFITYFEEENRPQTKLDRDTYNGMGITAGRLRKDNLFDIKFVSLSHNTLRGAAGGAVLMAELLCEEGYIG